MSRKGNDENSEGETNAEEQPQPETKMTLVTTEQLIIIKLDAILSLLQKKD
jgi:hypothetical protein